MQLGALVADANGKTRGERCGLLPTWLSATASDWLEYARSASQPAPWHGQGTLKDVGCENWQPTY